MSDEFMKVREEDFNDELLEKCDRMYSYFDESGAFEEFNDYSIEEYYYHPERYYNLHKGYFREREKCWYESLLEGWKNNREVFDEIKKDIDTRLAQ